jgi:hypothetical protein
MAPVVVGAIRLSRSCLAFLSVSSKLLCGCVFGCCSVVLFGWVDRLSCRGFGCTAFAVCGLSAGVGAVLSVFASCQEFVTAELADLGTHSSGEYWHVTSKSTIDKGVYRPFGRIRRARNKFPLAQLKAVHMGTFRHLI